MGVQGCWARTGRLATGGLGGSSMDGVRCWPGRFGHWLLSPALASLSPPHREEAPPSAAADLGSVNYCPERTGVRGRKVAAGAPKRRGWGDVCRDTQARGSSGLGHQCPAPPAHPRLLSRMMSAMPTWSCRRGPFRENPCNRGRWRWNIAQW